MVGKELPQKDILRLPGTNYWSVVSLRASSGLLDESPKTHTVHNPVAMAFLLPVRQQDGKGCCYLEQWRVAPSRYNF